MLQTSQVLSWRLCVSCAEVLPFKDSEGGTWPLQLSDFNPNSEFEKSSSSSCSSSSSRILISHRPIKGTK